MLEKQGQLNDVVIQVFDRYLQFKESGGTDVGQFITSELSPERASEIIQTIDLIESNYDEIQTYKKNGRSLGAWLKDKVVHIADRFNDGKRSEVASVIDVEVISASEKLLSEMNEAKQASSPIPLSSYDLEGLPGRLVQTRLAESMATSANIVTAVAGQWLEETIQTAEQEVETKVIEPLKQYVETKLTKPMESEVKKVMTTALAKAADSGYVKALEGKSGAELSAYVDRGMTLAKSAFQIATGQINVNEAVNQIIDRTAAQVTAVVTKTCERAGGFVGARVGNAIGALLGPAGAVVGGIVGETVGRLAGRAVGGKIGEGISKIANKAKEYTGKAITAVKSAASKVKNFFKSFWE